MDTHRVGLLSSGPRGEQDANKGQASILGGKPQGRHTLLDKQHHRNVNVSSKQGDACRILCRGNAHP